MIIRIVGIQTQLRNLKTIKVSKMTKISSAIFKTFFLSLCIVANTHFAFAQTASILPQGYTQYLDSNGKPLSAGKVYNYIPSTTTFKTTWQDAAETIPNTNPVTLDAAGRAKILGDGSYRQIVKDRNGVTIWDAVTSSTGSGSTSPVSTGDGDLVGTIKPWAGIVAPNQYAFAYGQEISRTTYSTLYTAITSTQAAFCTSGSPTLTGLSDTTNFWVGMSVEASCLAAGFSTIISKTSSSVTLAANANVSTNINAIFYPWGRGNGTTTFNLPDLRGVVLAGNNNMGGVASANLTTTYFGSTDPNSAGALGGSQSKTFDNSNVPTLTGTNHIAAAITGTSTDTDIVQNAAGVLSSNAGGGANGQLSGTGGSIGTIAVTGTSAINAISTITNSGGVAFSATIGAVGSGYTNGAQTITVLGGTCTTQPQFTVTIAGNVFTGTPALLTAGNCTVPPNNPASTSGGGGTGGILNVRYNAQPFSLIQPTRTTNYIIKITPDTNSAIASGVTSLGSMTGDISCGAGLLCTGNNISTTSTPLVVGSTAISGGTTTRVLYDNGGALGEYSISGTGNVAMTTSPSFTTPSLGVATATSLALNGCTIGANIYCITGNSAIGGTLVITSTNANTLNVGANGATNPVIQVDNSVASQADGIRIVGNAAGSGAGINAISPNASTVLGLNGKGAGEVRIANVSTGPVTIGNAGGGVSIGSAITYGGVTLSNAVTGTGNMVLSNSPTFSGTIGGTGVVPAAALANTAVTPGSYGGASAVATFTVDQQGRVTAASNATITAVNGMAVTSCTSCTLAVASNKTATISNTLTFTGTDGSSVAFGTGGTVSYTIASGTKALATSAIASATCSSAQTATATGATTSSVVDASFASDPTAVTGYTPATTGMLTIISYATADTVNFKVCNNTASSITPGAISLNWRVRS